MYGAVNYFSVCTAGLNATPFPIAIHLLCDTELSRHFLLMSVLSGRRQLLSYTSDVMVAGASFTPGPRDRMKDALSATVEAATPPYNYHQHPHRCSLTDPTRSLKDSASVYLHVVDRLRTLRTWLLHPGGATAVSAYSLPAAAPRVPRNVTPPPQPEVSTHEKRGEGPGRTGGGDADPAADPRSPSSPVGPEYSLSPAGGSSLLSRGSGRDEAFPEEGEGRTIDNLRQGWRRRPQPTGSRQIIDGIDADGGTQQEDDEEAVRPGSLPAGALVAAVLPSRLQGPDAASCSGILVAAGVALSGFSFLREERECDEGQGFFLWASEERLGDGSGREGEGGPPRVLGMRALVPRRGNQQALALVWAERPSFQVLDVSRRGCAGVVEHISLARRHR